MVAFGIGGEHTFLHVLFVPTKRLKGIDIIRFDEQGLITEFEVMIRPLNGLQALGAEMGARLGQQLPGFKTRA